ncbi:MAG TPA: DoxX family protein [Polyangiaceae bacterium]|jgi:hypothetical protein|nr:DoxX family protein [Polyangiaceae bacterium]
MTTRQILVETPSTTHRSSLLGKLGYGLGALPCALLFTAGLTKLMPHPSEAMLQGMQHMGVAPSLLRIVGVIELAVVALCLVPRTAFLGAILFTGWAGGAIMTHLRVGEPAVVQALLAVVVWTGLALRRPTEFKALLGLRAE